MKPIWERTKEEQIAWLEKHDESDWSGCNLPLKEEIVFLEALLKGLAKVHKEIKEDEIQR